MSPYVEQTTGTWSIANPPTVDGKVLWGEDDHVVIVNTRMFLKYIFYDRFEGMKKEFMRGKRFYI